ncbi:MAG: hypothetical protein M3Q69_10205 [Acidobacteriota bacterium]|nr:hypothetical protein [Acidobacteriota bacterium]
MRHALGVVFLLFVTFSSRAADPVYLDQLMETPLGTLQAQFPGLKREGCYALADGHFLLISIDRKDGKPWRIALTNEAPCRKPESSPATEIALRKGVILGDSTVKVVEKMGRPDAAAAPEPSLKKLGDLEYFYVCRESEGCARHTSIFMRGGVVTAVAEWYSQ